jgi:hypothetical protein
VQEISGPNDGLYSITTTRGCTPRIAFQIQ